MSGCHVDMMAKADPADFSHPIGLAVGSLDIFIVEVDLSAFGFSPGQQTQRVRLQIFDVGLGTKSADIGALGAINSLPIPEPATGFLVVAGLTILAAYRNVFR